MKRRLILATLAFVALAGLLVWDARVRAAALITVNGTQVIVMTADELTAALERAKADALQNAKTKECNSI